MVYGLFWGIFRQLISIPPIAFMHKNKSIRDAQLKATKSEKKQHIFCVASNNTKNNINKIKQSDGANHICPQTSPLEKIYFNLQIVFLYTNVSGRRDDINKGKLQVSSLESDYHLDKPNKQYGSPKPWMRVNLLQLIPSPTLVSIQNWVISH